ncbi:unnamed protein product [Durusdinium trenchii]|uniref:Uncharacterized protein n=1 Tax=Durusdinium trenchii TaxID=1381693 RepID=A0ABP0MX56_9DINO
MERQKRGPELHLTELQKADARGLALLQELMDVLQRRDLAVSDRERYRMAAEDVEPIFQVLHELLETCEASAAQLHSAARAAAADGPADAEIWELFRVADRAEDDVQLKRQLVESLSHASNVEQVMAVQVMWSCKPYLEPSDEPSERLSAER